MNNLTEVKFSTGESLPVNLVPTPTMEYRTERKKREILLSSGTRLNAKQATIPRSNPELQGSRVVIYKQDPSVQEMNLRKIYLSSPVSNGPADARIVSDGLPEVSKNALGDFIQTPDSESFHSVQAFSVVRLALTMTQRVLIAAGYDHPVPWQWNSETDADPIKVSAHGLPGVMNAFYSRDKRALKFGHFTRPGSIPPEKVYTCLSLDIVAHETGHAILDALQPGWINASKVPEMGALHESFGDLTAIFLSLSFMDVAEAVVAQTKADLHTKTFLSEIAEEMGLSLGRSNGLRNADNNLRMSDVSTEVHSLSQVFTGAIYDILADIFNSERDPARVDDAKVLYDQASYLYGLLLRAIISIDANKAIVGFAHVASNMAAIATADHNDDYAGFIIDRFAMREIDLSDANAFDGGHAGLEDAGGVANMAETQYQDRSRCCGTMKLEEYCNGREDRYFDDERDKLRNFFN